MVQQRRHPITCDADTGVGTRGIRFGTMAREVYSGKISQWSTSSQKSKSSALIGLMPESSHDLRKHVRSRTRPDGTGGTYTALTRCGCVRKMFRGWRRYRDWPNILPFFNGDQTTRILSTVRDFLFILGVPNQIDNLPWRPILLVFRRTWDQRRRCLGGVA